MEGIFIMLLYLIAGFFKNRRDKAKRDKIQSDPNWDDSKSSNDLNFNFENIFKEIAGDSIEKNKNEIDKPIVPSEIANRKINSPKADPQKDNSVNIKKTNNGKELDFSNNQNATNQVRKRVKKTELNLKLSLSNISSIRRAIILKEVLDKPISLR
tara:strand:- start:552 stop:1016 length:465 start_codon:yes stop_codon:yes gene_type:complete